LRRQFDAPFTDVKAFVVNAALPRNDVQVLAGDACRHKMAVLIELLFETAQAASLAGLLPFRHQCE
jgi:hypothetical protein